MPKTQTFTSTAIAGASYELKRVGRVLRNQVEFEVAPIRHSKHLIRQKLVAILPALENTDADAIRKQYDTLEDGDRLKADTMYSQLDYLETDLRLDYVRRILVSFILPGPDYSDVKTADDLLEFGPEAFVDEVAESCSELWGLTPAQKKTSSPPITSTEPAAGPIPITTASDVSSGANIVIETAS